MTKTDREIELEKKLSIAVKALKKYADEECWEDTYVAVSYTHLTLPTTERV